MNLKLSNLQAIDRAVTKRLEAMGPVFKQAVETEKDVLIQRTQSGIGLNGRNFKAYSRKKDWNWRDVRLANDKQVARVDLTFDGDMFNALKVIVRRDGAKFLATLFFNERKQAQKAKGHHTGQLGKTTFSPRKFFGFSGSQRETIANKIRNAK